MSRENVAVVRRATQPYDGEDLVPLVRGWFESVDWSDREAVAAMLAEDAEGRYLHPDIEWEAPPVTDGVVHGLDAGARYWADWVPDWESYVYRVEEYRDLGSWVLTQAAVKAVGRGGLPLQMRVFQVWQVSGGMVTVCRAFGSEAEALEAVGLRESRGPSIPRTAAAHAPGILPVGPVGPGGSDSAGSCARSISSSVLRPRPRRYATPTPTTNTIGNTIMTHARIDTATSGMVAATVMAREITLTHRLLVHPPVPGEILGAGDVAGRPF